MAVFIYDADALEKMAEVEAIPDGGLLLDRWLEQQRSDEGGPCTFLLYRNEWEKTWRPRLASWRPEELKNSTVRNPQHGDVAIYGAGGWHRYCVNGDGELVFLPEFARKEAVVKAKAVGFTIFGRL